MYACIIEKQVRIFSEEYSAKNRIENIFELIRIGFDEIVLSPIMGNKLRLNSHSSDVSVVLF